MLAATGTCTRCGDEPVTVVHVPHRGRYRNGHRAITAHEAICGGCVTELRRTYTLDTDDGFGPSYFVEGWHAEGLLEAYDSLGGHS